MWRACTRSTHADRTRRRRRELFAVELLPPCPLLLRCPSSRNNSLQTELEHDVCLQGESASVKPPRVNVLVATVLFAAGAALSWIIMWSRKAALLERMKASESENARLAAELAAERAARVELAAAKALLGAELAAERAGAEARVAELRSAHDRLKAEFAELSASALRTNRDDFLKLAEQSFAQLHDKSAGDLAT